MDDGFYSQWVAEFKETEREKFRCGNLESAMLWLGETAAAGRQYVTRWCN
jgi:hypothetical protein